MGLSPLNSLSNSLFSEERTWLLFLYLWIISKVNCPVKPLLKILFETRWVQFNTYRPANHTEWPHNCQKHPPLHCPIICNVPLLLCPHATWGLFPCFSLLEDSVFLRGRNQSTFVFESFSLNTVPWHKVILEGRKIGRKAFLFSSDKVLCTQITCRWIPSTGRSPVLLIKQKKSK